MRHWLALAKAPRLASQKHPILVLDGPSHDLHISQHVPVASALSCFLANDGLAFAPVARVPSARSARDGELPLCNCACPCVPPLCVACAPSVCAPSCPLCWNARIASADDL